MAAAAAREAFGTMFYKLKLEYLLPQVSEKSEDNFKKGLWINDKLEIIKNIKNIKSNFFNTFDSYLLIEFISNFIKTEVFIKAISYKSIFPIMTLLNVRMCWNKGSKEDLQLMIGTFVNH